MNPETTRERTEPAFLRAIDWISKAAAVIAGVALVALIVNVTLDVLARTLNGRPLGLTLELTSFWWMPVLVGLSYALAQQKNEHITVMMLLDRLPARGRRIVEGVFSALGTGIVVLLAWFAWVAASGALDVGLRTNTDPPVDYWQAKYLVAIGLTLFALQLAATTVRHIIGTSVLVDELSSEGDVL